MPELRLRWGCKWFSRRKTPSFGGRQISPAFPSDSIAGRPAALSLLLSVAFLLKIALGCLAPLAPPPPQKGLLLPPACLPTYLLEEVAAGSCD